MLLMAFSNWGINPIKSQQELELNILILHQKPKATTTTKKFLTISKNIKWNLLFLILDIDISGTVAYTVLHRTCTEKERWRIILNKLIIFYPGTGGNHLGNIIGASMSCTNCQSFDKLKEHLENV